MPIRVGVQLAPQHCTYEQLAAAAVQAEALGFDSLWTWDHFYPMYGVQGAPVSRALPALPPELIGHHFEGWTLLTAMACLTRRVEVGMLVSGNSYRNPHLLADMARTLDHVSGGRAILGIGAGWYDKDYDEYGYPLLGAAERLRALQSSLRAIRRRLGELAPAPGRRRLPILIGGGGERVTLRLVAQHADLWNGAGTLQEMTRKMAVLDEWCARVGRDPGEIERSWLSFGPDPDLLDDFLAAGVTHFIVGVGAPFDFSAAGSVLEWRNLQDRAGGR
jgi:probable F420-dependent oxidoreductase